MLRILRLSHVIMKAPQAKLHNINYYSYIVIAFIHTLYRDEHFLH